MSHQKLVIIGSGPAGYTAAIYSSRAQLQPLLFAGAESGGQLMYTTEVENFPGFPEGIMGPKLMTGFKKQAERFGTRIEHQLVTAVDFNQRPFKLWTHLPEGYSANDFKKEDAAKIKQIGQVLRQTKPDVTANAVIVSTGAAANRLHVPGEDKFFGRGVSTCAVCDAAFFKDKQVYVIGGGDSAMEDALALANFTDKVVVVHRRDQFSASRIMSQRVLDHNEIDVMWNASLKAVKGDQVVKSIVIEQEGREKTLPADGIFLAIGHHPVSLLFQDQLQLDKKGYVVTSHNLSRSGLELSKQRLNKQGLVKFPSMTSVPGVFAAGDITDVHYWQAITAAGLGAAAALDAERWLGEQE
jgi:thioredoxin reductase (NADPH)